MVQMTKRPLPTADKDLTVIGTKGPCSGTERRITVFDYTPAAGSSRIDLSAADSLSRRGLLNVIEDEFHIELDLDDIADLTTFDRVLKYIESKSERNAAAS